MTNYFISLNNSGVLEISNNIEIPGGNVGWTSQVMISPPELLNVIFVMLTDLTRTPLDQRLVLLTGY